MRNDLSGKELIEWARKTRENVWDSDILKETQEGWRNNTANAIIKACEHIERDGVDQERAWLLGGFVEYYVVLIDVVRKLAENSWEVDNDTCWEIHDDFMTRCHTDQWEKTLDKCIKYKLDPTRMYAIAIANAMLRRRRLYSKGLRNVRLLDDGLTVEFELETGERVFVKPESVQTSSARPLEDPVFIEVENDYDGPWCIFRDGDAGVDEKVMNETKKSATECMKEVVLKKFRQDTCGDYVDGYTYAEGTDDAGCDILDDEKEDEYGSVGRDLYKYRVGEFVERFKRQVTSMGGSVEDVKVIKDQGVIKLTYGPLEVKRNIEALKDDREWAEDYGSSEYWKWFAESEKAHKVKNSRFFDIFCRIEAFLDNETRELLFIDSVEGEGQEAVHLCDVFHQVCARICDQQLSNGEEVKIENLPLVYALTRNTVGTDRWKEYAKKLNGRRAYHQPVIVSEYCLYITALILGLKPDNQTYEPWEIDEKLWCNYVRYTLPNDPD